MEATAGSPKQGSCEHHPLSDCATQARRGGGGTLDGELSASRQSASYMLRSAFARALGRVAIQCQSWVVQPGAVQQPSPQWSATRGLTTSAARRGIEDFLDAQRKPGEYPKAGTSSGQSGPTFGTSGRRSQRGVRHAQRSCF